MFESDLFPYNAVTTLAAQSVLIFAPHPDDEVFGCAGAIRAHVKSGVKVCVVVLTDGAAGGQAEQRQLESQEAKTLLGYERIEFWELPDREIKATQDLIARVHQSILSAGADLVYAPSPWEIHPDHRQTSIAVSQAVSAIGGSLRLAFYEIGAPLRPNTLLDTTEHKAMKDAAMACFASQHQRQNYSAHIQALNSYRTYTLAPSVTSAEAYLLLKAEELSDFFRQDLEHLVSWGAHSASGTHEGQPLVSIIIRSTDRVFLSEALDSVALQTWPRVEVLLVAATPEHHQPASKCGRFNLKFIPTSVALHRSAAANKGLDHASGEFILFLDDDDWLMPGHVARLAHALLKLPNVLGIYTGVNTVNQVGERIDQIFDEPYDPVKHQSVNLMPIHAMLFRSEVLAKGCRFDESLDVFEDWDFWLQVGRLKPLAHLPGVSATYRIHESSGVHHEKDSGSLATDIILNKWEALWTTQDRSRLLERLRSFDATLDRANHLQMVLESRNKEHAQDIGMLRDQLQAVLVEEKKLRHQVHIQQAEIQGITSSKSWRMTQPLRTLRRLVEQVAVVRDLIKAYRIVKNEGPRALARKLLNRGKFVDLNYHLWRQTYGAAAPGLVQRLELEVSTWTSPPLVSLLMPVFNAPMPWLNRAIESVLAQSYPHWELCIADDASTNSKVRDCLQGWAKRDSRIKLVLRQHNGHISAASNSALAMATGEWVGLLDQDDELEPTALAHMVRAIRENPQAYLFYSDEDKVDERGHYFAPYFKPDFNFELFLSQNYLTHFSVYKRDMLHAVGGFQTGLEGAQDYDLALRCLLAGGGKGIVHVPLVLYHWRVLPGSTALSGQEKPYAQLAGQKAIQNFLEASHLGGQVECLPNGFYRINAAVDTPSPMVSIIIPTRNGQHLVEQCLSSIYERSTYKNFEVILVDNGSDDPLALACFERWQTTHGIRVIRDDRPFNYSSLNNNAVAQAQGEFICLLNNDIEVLTPSWLEEMLSLALRPGVGAVGARLWYPDRTLQHGGVIIGLGGVAGHAHLHLSPNDPGYFGRGVLTQQYSALTGACLLLSRENYQLVEGLNEVDLTVAFNDIDLCLKLLDAGLRNIWTPWAELIHHESATRGSDLTPGKKERFEKEVRYMQHRWGQRLNSDPCYNPNLSLVDAAFTLAWPPRH